MWKDSGMQTPLTLSRRAMRDEVHDAVLAMLMDGRLAAGASVGIDSLARDLGVSPTPVREALVELEGTGLVHRVAHRGYQVAPPMTAEQAAQLVDARLVVETAAAAWAARRADPELLAELRKALTDHQAAAGIAVGWDHVSRDRNGLPVGLREYFEADWAFHQAILDHCGNPFLRRMAASLGASVHRMRQSAVQGPVDAPLAVAEHSAVLAAMESGSAEAAEAAMRAHLSRVRERSMADA